MGRWAYRFADFLFESGQSVWQVLPLGPPAYGHSPYQCYSSMAGNPLLVSLESLCEEGLLKPSDLTPCPDFPETEVNFPTVIAFRRERLRSAALRFFESGGSELHREFDAFCAEKAGWLNKFAQFAALSEVNGGAVWSKWKKRSRPSVREVRIHKFIQFEFFRQWGALKRYCNDRGIEIIGDLPIFVAYDSADVWGNPRLFDLDEVGQPRHVAGVPPDYFSATGQLWGNPLYRWDENAKQGYRWWIDRVGNMLDLVDIIRIDHFRGFEKYYEIPGNATNAVGGRWVEGPGDDFFAALVKAFGRLPFIAEDLGYITPEVHALRDRWGLPGMCVLQFAFVDDSNENPYKPYNFTRNCVVYTGTHDNDTTVGWFTGPAGGVDGRSFEEVRLERALALRYLQSDGREIHWDFIRAALSSVADTAVFPMQDLLGLGSGARMNRPASVENNWRWRMTADQLSGEIGSRLLSLTKTYGRFPRRL